MSIIEKTLNEKLEDINKHLEMVDVMLGACREIPDYKVRVTSGNGCSQYYYRNDANEYIYIPSAKRDFAKRLIQKDYYNRVKEELTQQKRLLERFISGYKVDALENVYRKSCKGRKNLLKPIELTDEEYVEKWMEKHQGMQNPYNANMSIKTKRGEYVRSKSEKILADLFYENGIPYQYEPAFRLINGKLVYPDFVLLNVRERKTYYWEHYGLASDESYSNKNIDKLCLYENSGLRIGDNLIISLEAEGIPLDISLIQEKITNILL